MSAALVKLVRRAAVLAVLAVMAGAAVAAPTGGILHQGSPMHGSFGLRFGPDGNLYICSFSGLFVLDPTRGEMVGYLGPESGVVTPEDVNFGPDGSLYWASMFTGYVGRRQPDGTTTTQMVAPFVNPIAFSPDGRLFVSEPWFSDTLFEVDPALSAPPTPLISGLGGLKGLEFGADGLLYAALMWKGEVVRIDLAADPPTVETVASGLGAPFTAKFGPDGLLYVVERVTSTIQRVDPATGVAETWAELPWGPDNLAFDPLGNAWVSSYTDGAIAVVNPNGAVVPVIPGGLIMPSGITVEPRADGESVWVGCTFSLREIDGATGVERRAARYRFTPDGVGAALSVSWSRRGLVTSTIFPLPRVQVWNPVTSAVIEDHLEYSYPINAIALGDDLIVADLGRAPGEARVVRVSQGASTTLADASAGLYAPTGLAASDDDVWVSDWATGTVWQILVDGAVPGRPILVADGLAGPEGLALDHDGTLLVAEAGAGRISRIHLGSRSVSEVASGLAIGMPGVGALAPMGFLNAVAVGPSGAIYIASDLANLIYKLEPKTSWLPVAAHLDGLAGAAWRTSLSLHNRGADRTTYTIALLPRGYENRSPRTVTFALEPNRSVRYPDALADLFQFEGAAALRITANGGDLLATSRSWTACDRGTCGQAVPECADEEAITEAREGRLVGLRSSGGFRTNIGVVNAGSTPAVAEVALFLADGTLAGSLSIRLGPFGNLQVQDLFTSLERVEVGQARLAEVDEAWATVRTTTVGARVFAYASVVDNRSNDGMTIPAR